MKLERIVQTTNAGMIGFDLALGTAALLAPDATLRLLGHDAPSPDARALFRRCGPIWLTFAAAHATAAVRGGREDFWALAWLRGTELLTDVVWASSPAIRRASSRAALRGAGLANLALAAGFATVARRR